MLSPLSINNSYSLHQLLIQSFPFFLPLSASVYFSTSHGWPCVNQMRMLDLQVGSKSIRDVLWLSVSWHLCVCLFISLLLLLSCSSSSRLPFFPSLSLFNNADALHRLQPSEEERVMLGYLCVSVCVCVCAGIHGHACVAVREDSAYKEQSILSPLRFWAVAVIEVFSFSCKKKKRLRGSRELHWDTLPLS